MRLASLLASRSGVGFLGRCATLTDPTPTQLALWSRPGNETGQLLKGRGLRAMPAWLRWGGFIFLFPSRRRGLQKSDDFRREIFVPMYLPAFP